jgi:hypothetical protein
MTRHAYDNVQNRNILVPCLNIDRSVFTINNNQLITKRAYQKTFSFKISPTVIFYGMEELDAKNNKEGTDGEREI